MKLSNKRLHDLSVSGEALIFVAAMMAGVGWMASKEVIRDIPITNFIGWRFILAALVLLPWCLPDIRRLAIKTIAQALLLGVVLAAALLLWIYALSISPSMGEGAFIMTMAILLAPMVGWGLFRTPSGAAFWMILPLAAGGVACLSLTDGWQIGVGQLVFLASAFLASLHFNLNKYLSGKIRILPLVCLQLFAVGGCNLLLSQLQDHGDTPTTFTTWVWFTVSVLLCTSLRYVLQTQGQHRISTSNAALMMILEPVWVLLLSIVVYHESLSLQKIIGCLLITSALLLYRRQLR